MKIWREEGFELTAVDTTGRVFGEVNVEETYFNTVVDATGEYLGGVKHRILTMRFMQDSSGTNSTMIQLMVLQNIYSNSVLYLFSKGQQVRLLARKIK